MRLNRITSSFTGQKGGARSVHLRVILPSLSTDFGVYLLVSNALLLLYTSYLHPDCGDADVDVHFNVNSLFIFPISTISRFDDPAITSLRFLDEPVWLQNFQYTIIAALLIS